MLKWKVVLISFVLILCQPVLANSPFNEKALVKIGNSSNSGLSGSISGTVSTNGANLNVRTGPWATIVGKLADKSKVQIVAQSGDWFKINYGGKIRYIHKNYVSINSSKAASAPKSSVGYVKVSTVLNVRTGPWGRIIGKLKNNSKVTIVGKSGNWLKISYNGRVAFIHKDYVSTKARASNPSSSSFSAYVNVPTSLNVRTEPWGKIIGSLKNNDKVTVVGKSGDWYKVKFNGRTSFIHSKYVSKNKSSASSGRSSGSSLVKSPASGSVAQKVAAAAQNLVTKYKTSGSFPYAAATQGGRLGCAQVVSTALMAAGVNTGIQLGVLATISKLKNLGWKEVRVPPYRAGDVITWKTYDRSGDGIKDSDTHIGVILTNGNSAQAMNNSSTRKKPVINSATVYPISRVLRKD